MARPVRKNRNRGYQQLRVWQDAIDYYVNTSRIFRKLPYDLTKIIDQEISSVDSVHRNIAEGYCRRSLKEYLYFLHIALGSLGESVSGLIAYNKAEQISDTDFDMLDEMAYRLENGMLKLVEALNRKSYSDLSSPLMVKEINTFYNS